MDSPSHDLRHKKIDFWFLIKTARISDKMSRKSEAEEMAEALKVEGNKLFQAGDNEGAVKKYTEAIAIDPKVFFIIIMKFFI